ncbi:fatty acyl-AMP ligase [Nonomuraea soli]|uniref:Fatty acid CoA ligase FadD32 n=1 Tax=Nonomuraea soli TaxID=1032476 RepID=A0A7W0CQ82_9ACTN|nr:fatty acyl-AMP ligase [Nonomuraea soli]MBA2895321.1 fatty acid CoA ligase FadD32 [Nonomuraea soli]
MLLARVAQWAREIPDAPAYTFVDHLGDGARHTLTWRQADLKARALAVRLGEVAGPGDRVALLLPQGLSYVVAMLGTLYAGLVAVPLFSPDLPGHASRLDHAFADAAPSVVLTTRATLPLVTEFGESVVLVDTVSDLLADEFAGLPDLDQDDLAYLQYTSGSTRAPAGVEITHGNVSANAAQLYSAFRGTPRTSTAALWLPLFHDMGLIATIMAPIVGGNHVAFMDPVAFVMKPSRWFELLASFDDVFTGGPNFAYEYCLARCTDDELAGLDLSGVQVMLNGAEPVRPATVERFNARFAPYGLRPEAHTPAYGLAEATVFVTATGRDEPARFTRFCRDSLNAGRAVPHTGDGPSSTLVSCGRPYGQEIKIAADGGHVGEIWVKGPNVARAYWQDPERTAEVFTGDGWLRTGDLGVIHDGELYVTGRVKDLVIVDGRNHYPQDIETTIQEADESIRRDHVAAFAVQGDETERLVVVAERSRRGAGVPAEEIAGRVRAAVAGGHNLAVHDFVLVEAGEVPRTSSGKIARRACREAYLAGALSGV